MEIKTVLYEIEGLGLHTYCKMYKIHRDTLHAYTISFGTKKKDFCITASYNHDKSDEIYIDRIEKKNNCIVGKSFDEIKEGTIKLVNLSLSVLKIMFPLIKKFAFVDASQIKCSNNDTMSMALDYIIKYNKTWYEKQFGAELPEKNGIKKVYTDSLLVLDRPSIDFLLVKNAVKGIELYEDAYIISKTPREFINHLRKKLGKNYCKDIGTLLSSYMEYLRVNVMEKFWYIPSEHIKSPRLTIKEINNKDIISRLDGGSRKNRRPAKVATKTSKNTIRYEISSDKKRGYIIGDSTEYQ